LPPTNPTGNLKTTGSATALLLVVLSNCVAETIEANDLQTLILINTSPYFERFYQRAANKFGESFATRRLLNRRPKRKNFALNKKEVIF
jgi:hypothetical protein